MITMMTLYTCAIVCLPLQLLLMQDYVLHDYTPQGNPRLLLALKVMLTCVTKYALVCRYTKRLNSQDDI